MTGCGRILHFESFIIGTLLNIVIIKSKIMRCGGHVAYIEKVEMHTKNMVVVEGLKGTDHSEDLGVDGILILKLIFRKWGGGAGFIWLRTGTCGGLLRT